MSTMNVWKPGVRRSRSRQARVFLSGVLVLALLLSMLAPIAPAAASPLGSASPASSLAPDAPDSFPLTETFMGPTAPGWVLGGTAILTSGNGDPANNGWLRLTRATTNQAGFAYYNTAIPTDRGLVITFDYKAWGGTGADGTTFFLFDGATTTFNVGASGGSLGYAQKTGVNGLSNGYLGLGLDEFGNYSNPNEGRLGGPGFIAHAVALRGPGNRTTGYPYLAGTTNLTQSPWNLSRLDCPRNYQSCGNGSSRPTDANYYRQVQITVTPVGAAYQVSVAMKFSSSATSWTPLFGPYRMTTSAPGTLKMGFAASTGGSTNYHEIRNLTITQQVPDLTASKAVQNATTGGGSVAPGDQLLYTVVLKNNTSTAITGVSFSDPIPANTSYVANSASLPFGATLVATTPTLEVSGIAVPASGQATITFKVQVDNPLPTGVTQISNQGEYTYGTTTSQTDGDAVVEGDQPTVISVTAGPNFDTTTKTVSVFNDVAPLGAVSAGDTLLYRVVLPNSGNQNSPTLAFTDPIPPNTTYVSGSATVSRGTVSYNSTTKTLSWSVSVDAGSQATLEFKVTVNSGVQIRDVISNQGTVTYGTTTVLTDADLATPGKQPTQLLVGGVATLTATKTASVVSSPLQPGGDVIYTIELTNTSSYAISGATFVDTLPVNTSYVSHSTDVGSATFTSPTLNVTGINLNAGAKATITFRVRVDNPLPIGVTQISNQGVARWDSNNSGANNASLQTDGDPAIAGQQPTVNTIANADLALTKTVNNPLVPETGAVAFTVRVTNNGPASASNVVVTDALPDGLDLVSSSATQGSYTSPTWTVGTLASGASATLTINTTASLAWGGSRITNNASAASSLYDAYPGNNAASAYVDISITRLTGVVTDAATGAPLAGVTVKVTDVDSRVCTATTNGSGVYTVTSGESGCVLAPGAATVETTSAPAGYLMALANKTITAGVTNVQDLALVRPSLSGVVTDLGTGVPILGATVTVTQGATVCTTTTGAGGAYSFTAGVGDPVCNITSGAATITASAARYQTVSHAPVTILATGPTTKDLGLGTADLLIMKDDGKTTVQPGETLSYVLTVVNNGSITAENVKMVDTLPAYLSYVSASGTGWGCSPNGTSTIITCTVNTGSIAEGVSMSVTLVAKVATTLPDGTTRITNYAHVSTTSPEKDTTNNEVTDVDTVTTHPDLSIAKTFTSNPPATSGSIVSYQLSGSNLGYAIATGVKITDTLDALSTYTTTATALSINGTPTSTLTVDYNNATKKLIFSLPNLKPGDTYLLTYDAKVGTLPDPPSSLLNSATIGATQTDLDTGNNTAGVYVPTINAADLVVVKSAQTASALVVPGSLITYTLNYRNDGVDSAANAEITDTVPANTTLVNGSITGGGTVSNGIITWDLNTLASQATGSVRFTVKVDSLLPAGAHAIANTAFITTTTLPDASPLDNVSSVSTSVTAQPDLVIVKTDGKTQVLAGDVVDYTITYRNAGDQDATGVTIVDTLLNGLAIDESQLSGSTYNGSTPPSIYNAGAGTLTWTIGALPVSETFSTITVRLKVNASAAPGSVVANRVEISDDENNGDDPNPGDNISTDSNLVIAPYIVLEKHASVPVGNPASVGYTGQQVTYTINWRNTGETLAKDIVIHDTLPVNTALVDGSITGGGSIAGGVITWNLGDKAAGASGSVSFAVTVNPGAGGTNQPSATLSSESISGSVVITSSTHALDLPWCEFDKCSAFRGLWRDEDGTPPPGYNDNPRLTVFDDSAWTAPVASSEEEFAYWTDPDELSAEWVAINTTGLTYGNFTFFRQAFCLPLNATGLSATLELAGDDASDIFLNGVYLGQEYGAGGASSFNGNGGIQSGINILAVQLLTNRHGGHNLPGCPGCDHSGLLFRLNAAHTGLRPFVKAPTTVLAGQNVTFTADEMAIGGRMPYSYTIDFGDGQNAAYQLSNTFTHAYAEAGVYTATVTARAQYGCTGSDRVVIRVLADGSTLLANSATAGYADANSQSFSSASGAGLDLHQAADLSIEKTAAGGTTPGQGVTYEIVVTNNGPDEVSNAVVEDTAPAGLTIGDWTCEVASEGSGGTVTTACGAASGSGNIDTTATLKNGGSVTYTVSGMIASSATGSIANMATVAPPAGVTDLNNDNNSNTASTNLTPSVALAVTKTSSPKPGLAAGRGVVYDIVVKNTGPSDAVDVSVTDTFPASLIDVTWTCAASASSTCTASGSGDIADTVMIKGGGVITYTARATVDPDATGAVENTAAAAYGLVSDEDTDSNTLVAMTTLIASKDVLDDEGNSSRSLPFIDLDSNGGISPGDTLEYKVVITNTGATTAYNVLYADAPDPNTTLVTGSVTCDPACTVVLGNDSGNTTISLQFASLAPGATATIIGRATVNSPLPFQVSTLTNQGYASASNANSVATDDPFTPEVGDRTVVTLTMASISGVVWRDDNHDGIKDAGEPGLAAIPVTLYYAGVDGEWDTQDDQTAYGVTEAGGAYSFASLAAGKYKVGFYQLIGFNFSPKQNASQADPVTGLTHELNLALNATMTAIDAGQYSQSDFGNLPPSFKATTLDEDGARHVISGTLLLGSSILIENDGEPGRPADNDGVELVGDVWMPGETGTLTVTLSARGRVWAWFDWNANGVFDEPGSGEDGTDEAVDLGVLDAGEHEKSFEMPDDYSASALYVRFRVYSEDYAQEFVPYGAVFGGEVEDYGIPISPLAVTLESFSAVQLGDAVLVTWETNSELNNRGFNLYRGTSSAGHDRQLNTTLIPSQSPGNPTGFVYTWEDRADLVPGATYYYWLEDLDNQGVTTMHGPVSTTYVIPTAVTAGGLSAVAAAGSSLPLAGALLALLMPLAGALAVRRRRPAD